ncbi:hypothetical protein EDB19DRAFT_1629509 [Suillus lakei]|nr:hypothetical protein EDB19DRAFT_1629509 [Suillus lakei]
MSFHTLIPPEQVIIRDGQSIDATGIGHVLDVHVRNGEYKCTIIQDVYYIPDLDANLLTVPCLMQ